MEKIEIGALYHSDYRLEMIHALRQDREHLSFFSCIGKPKIYNMLLYLDGCKARYTLEDGTTVTANDGSIVYTPIHSQYSVEFYDFLCPSSCTIGVNFFLYDRQSNPFVLSDDVQVFRADHSDDRFLFHQIANQCQSNVPCKSRIKALIYEIFSRLSEFSHHTYRGKYRVISKGILYLEQDEEQRLSVREIAALCNVSEVYFRRLFKDYSGLTPTQYRAAAKLHRAKGYLKQDTFSVSEIARLLGFDDVSYFIKFFREQTGLTPNQYRKRFEQDMKRSLSVPPPQTAETDF